VEAKQRKMKVPGAPTMGSKEKGTINQKGEKKRKIENRPSKSLGGRGKTVSKTPSLRSTKIEKPCGTIGKHTQKRGASSEVGNNQQTHANWQKQNFRGEILLGTFLGWGGWFSL